MSRTANIGLKENISFTGDKLRVQPDVVKGFFTDVCQEIVRHLKEIFRQDEVTGIDTILMVGGFSESRMLQAAIKQNFPDKVVVIPAEAGLAVLKGAVIFGHKPTVIATRVSRYTYGVGTNVRFDSAKHPMQKCFVAEGIEYCSDVFDIHVNVGDEVEDGTTFETKKYIPLYSYATRMSISVYTADKRQPGYTDEEGCQKLGHIEVDLRKLRLHSEKEVAVCMKYGGTELHVEAVVVKTGQKANARFEFLT